MQNPLHFPYTFPVPNFANMIDCDFHHASTAAHSHSASLAISALQNSARGDSEVHRSSNNSLPNCNKSPSPQHHHLDPLALATSRLLFPPFLTHSLCGFPPSDDTISAAKDKLKRSGISSKSFMIDHLLGLNRLSAAASHHHLTHHQQLPLAGLGLGANLQNWKKSDNVKDGQSRYHPYHNNSSGGNLTTSNGINSSGGGGGGASNNQSVNNQSHHPNESSNNSKSKSTSQKSSNSGSAHAAEKSQESHQSSRRAAKAKRVRTIFTPEQLERLEAEFERQQYMVGPERLYLASSLNLTEAQVKVWFQNRRIKWRKQHLEIQQQRLAAFRSQHEEGDEENSSDFGSASSPTPTDVSSNCVNDLTAASSQVSPSANFSAHGSLVGNHFREALSSLQATSHHENESRSSTGSPSFTDSKLHSIPRSATSSEDY